MNMLALKEVHVKADTDALEACAAAATILRSIGFELVYTSMQSEACYYTLEGYHGAIRIAAHRFGRLELKSAQMPVVSKITFGTKQGPVTRQRVEQTVMLALGLYFYARLRYDPQMQESTE